MKKLLRSLTVTVLAVASLLVVLAGCLRMSDRADGPRPDANSAELQEAKAIGSALTRYADADGHVWPESLEVLKPAYLDPAIDVSRWRFFYAGTPRLAGRDGRVIAAKDAEGFTNHSICIYGTGQAGYLRLGE